MFALLALAALWQNHAPPRGYVLIISDGATATRINYSSRERCLKARDEVVRQTAPPPSSPGIIYGPSRTKAFCVPR